MGVNLRPLHEEYRERCRRTGAVAIGYTKLYDENGYWAADRNLIISEDFVSGCVISLSILRESARVVLLAERQNVDEEMDSGRLLGVRVNEPAVRRRVRPVDLAGPAGLVFDPNFGQAHLAVPHSTHSISRAAPRDAVTDRARPVAGAG